MDTLIIIIIVSALISLLSQLINKLLINEKRSDEGRARMKELQRKVKTVTDIKSKEYTQIQDEILDINFKIMKQQMKPMIFTFLPYIFVFYILAGAFAYMPLDVGTNVTVKITGNGMIYADCMDLNQTVNGTFVESFIVKSTDCTIVMNNNTINQSLADKTEIVSNNGGGMTMEVTPPKNIVLTLPFSIPFIGNSLGWLGTYILFSFVFSILLSKALKGRYLRKWD